MATMQKTTLYLPAEMHRQLEELAKRRKLPQAELIREALRLFLAQQERAPLRSFGAGRSKEITGRNAEAWLRENWHAR